MTRQRRLWIRQIALAPFVRRLGPVLYAAAFLWRRLLWRTTFIAVTGSLGKTTTKECLAEILASAAPTFRGFRNAGSGEAVALNLLRVRPWHGYAVLELAVGGPGMMHSMARLVAPDIAIILNVMRTHSMAFGSLDNHAREKELLLKHLRPGGLAILNQDDVRVRHFQPPAGRNRLFFGSTGHAAYRFEQVIAAWPQRLAFKLRTPAVSQPVRTQLVGAHWAPACAAALAAADAAGVPLSQAAAILERVLPFPGRMSPYQLPNGAIFLRDDYNATEDGLQATFDAMAQSTAERSFLVITDFSDFDGHRKRRLRFVAERAAGLVDRIVFIGETADYGRRRAIEAGMASGSVDAFPNQREAAELLRRELHSGDLVFLKGRTTDHVTRVFLAQLGEPGCWKDYCPKRMLCDICWEMQLTDEETERAKPLLAG